MANYSVLDTPAYSDILSNMCGTLAVIQNDFKGVFAYDKLSGIFFEFGCVAYAMKVDNGSFVIFNGNTIYMKYSKNKYAESAYTRGPHKLYKELIARERVLISSDKGLTTFNDKITYREISILAPKGITFTRCILYGCETSPKTLEIHYNNGLKNKTFSVTLNANAQNMVNREMCPRNI